MLRCKEVSRLYASDEIRAGSLRTRLGARLHLTLCRHCRRYVRELARIGAAVRDLYTEMAEDSDRNEAMVRRIVSDVSRPPS